MRSSVTLELKGDLNHPGFYPFLWSIVTKTTLNGWVSESVSGTLLRLEGEDDVITDFLKSFPAKLTRTFHLRSIRLVKRSPAALPLRKQEPFQIIAPHAYHQMPGPDLATCPDCIRRMLDPKSPDYRYPFVSCEKCGPRYSVSVLAGNFRETTAFRSFPPCTHCAEKKNILQVCPKCGPNVFLLKQNGESIPSSDPVAYAAEQIASGKILGVKMTDGFVIVCDPEQPEVLQKIRDRKHQPGKPIAVYARTTDAVKKICFCSEEEEKLLTSPTAPLLLLDRKPGVGPSPALCCPDRPETLGVQLPPNGLIRLLMESRPGENGKFRSFDVLAFSGGPHPVDPEDAGGDADLALVLQVADMVLMHDLRIWHNSGPSVQFYREDGLHTIRRSSGLCPSPLPLNHPLKRTVLAFGTDSSAAVAIGCRNRILLSHQMGSIASEENSRSLSLTAERMVLMSSHIPDMIVCDMDRELYSSVRALQIAEQYRIPLATAQRHHANALACLVEHHLENALALVFDGGAKGPDGTVWGAELLEISARGFRRLASFKPVQMTGPEERSLRPALVLYRYFKSAGRDFSVQDLETLGIPVPIFREWHDSVLFRETTPTHAALPLFDAVGALIGIAPLLKTYRGQTELRFENTLSQFTGWEKCQNAKSLFPFTTKLSDGICMLADWGDTFRNLSSIAEFRKHETQVLAGAFLLSVADAAAEMMEYALSVSKSRDIILSGSAFLSSSFTKIMRTRLEQTGCKVFRHEITSPDESSVSIGQAVFGGMAER